ncbi:MAG: D-cysteine desulfhydrase family protein [Anaerolineales bacterium]|nr:D-cysteine desulfhydrase family protein [Anaerolineales bacterium]
MRIDLPSLPLAVLPTPMHPLERLSRHLGGPQVFIKRDDLTGLAFGGNKTRKLSYLLAEAVAQGAEVLVTRGAVQSNHCRQTAAAAARCGLDCVLVLHGPPAPTETGNLLLDRLLGARVRWTEALDPESVLEEEIAQLQSQGRRVYRIPYGGSNALGASAYAAAALELKAQGEDFDRILFASSSGGTQAGLVAGARWGGLRSQILGISVEPPAAALRLGVADLATSVGQLLGRPGSFLPEEIQVMDQFRGGGYAVVGDLERQAIRLFARLEGILLDPVYTGRAAGAMLDLIQSGQIGRQERVLFWHTGGTPALFAYSEGLTGRLEPAS